MILFKFTFFLIFINYGLGCIPTPDMDDGTDEPITTTIFVPMSTTTTTSTTTDDSITTTTSAGSTTTSTSSSTSTTVPTSTTTSPITSTTTTTSTTTSTTTTSTTTTSPTTTTTAVLMCPSADNTEWSSIYIDDASNGMVNHDPADGQCECGEGNVYVYRAVTTTDTAQIIEDQGYISEANCVNVCICSATMCWTRPTDTQILIIPFCINSRCTMKVVIEGEGTLTSPDGPMTPASDQHVDGDVNGPYKDLSDPSFPTIDTMSCTDNCMVDSICHFSGI